MMVLYSGTTDPYSHRCRFVLFEKGMDFEIRDVDLFAKPEDIALVEKFTGRESKLISRADWPNELRDFVLPLTRDYQIDFDNVRLSSVPEPGSLALLVAGLLGLALASRRAL